MLTWPTIAHKKYTLYVSTDLGEESWEIIATVVGDGSPISQAVTITQPDGGRVDKLFFRVSVEDMDEDYDLLTAAEEAELGSSDETAFSDDDFLSDYYEATVSHTSPAQSSSSGDGVRDDQRSLPAAGGGARRYAPSLSWDCSERGLFYSYHKKLLFPGGPSDSAASWDPTVSMSSSWGASGHSGMEHPLSASEVSTMLEEKLPFPPGRSSGGFIGSLSGETYDSWNTEGNPDDHYEHAILDQARYRLVLSEPTFNVTYHRTLMTVSGNYPNPPLIEARESFVASRTVVSLPQLMDPGSWMDIYAPEFVNSGWLDAEGMDPTMDTLRAEVGVGGSTWARIQIGSISDDIRARLELAAASGNTYVSLGAIEPNFGFTISGINATPAPEKVVLRLKANPNVIFATMLVDVLPRRTVGVTIYYAYDSRCDGHAFGGEPVPTVKNPEILDTLNQTYVNQGNIGFRINQTVAVDVRRNPTSPPGAADEPQLFNTDGSFPDDSAKLAALDAFLRKRADSSKYNIVIVNRVSGTTAFTVKANHCSVIGAGATKFIYPHEVGHGIGLATRGSALDGWHDIGPWPAVWAEDAKLLQLPQEQWPSALMYPTTTEFTNPWIRAEDWIKANTEAAALE